MPHMLQTKLSLKFIHVPIFLILPGPPYRTGRFQGGKQDRTGQADRLSSRHLAYLHHTMSRPHLDGMGSAF